MEQQTMKTDTKITREGLLEAYNGIVSTIVAGLNPEERVIKIDYSFGGDRAYSFAINLVESEERALEIGGNTSHLGYQLSSFAKNFVRLMVRTDKQNSIFYRKTKHLSGPDAFIDFSTDAVGKRLMTIERFYDMSHKRLENTCTVTREYNGHLHQLVKNGYRGTFEKGITRLDRINLRKYEAMERMANRMMTEEEYSQILNTDTRTLIKIWGRK